MIISIQTNYDQFSLNVRLSTDSTERIRIILKDADYLNTQYYNRYIDLNGTANIKIYVPLCKKNALLYIYNENYGDNDEGDQTFTLDDKIRMLPLEKRLHVADFRNREAKAFIPFIEQFCINAGWIQSTMHGEYYQSKMPYDRRRGLYYKVEYLPCLYDEKGMPVDTCARIDADSGVIQFSQAKIIPMTVPGRMCIACHEFSHFWVNDTMEDETEGDLNGLLFYLGLGYPRIEALDAFTGAFMGAPTPQNKERNDIVTKFINDFDKQQMIIA